MSLVGLLTTASSSDELRSKFDVLEHLLNDDRDPEKLMRAIGSLISLDSGATAELKKVAGMPDEEMWMIAACAQTAVEFRSLGDQEYWEFMARNAGSHFLRMVCERLLLVLHRPEFGRAREVRKPENKAIVEFTYDTAERLIDRVPRPRRDLSTKGFLRLIAKQQNNADTTIGSINADISSVIARHTRGLLSGDVLGDHLVLAGGAVRDSMVARPPKDYDLWFVDVRDPAHAVAVMRGAIEKILHSAVRTRASEARLVLTPSVVTLEVHYDDNSHAGRGVVTFQFIKRLFLTAMQVLLSFDQDSAKFAMDGTFAVYGMVNAVSSLIGRYALVNPLMKTQSRRYGDQASKKESDVFAPNCASVVASVASVHLRMMQLPHPSPSGINGVLMDIVRKDSLAGIAAVGILMGKRNGAKWVDGRHARYGAAVTAYFEAEGRDASPADGIQGLFPDDDDGLMEAEFEGFSPLLVNNPASRMCVSGHDCEGIRNFLQPVV